MNVHVCIYTLFKLSMSGYGYVFV